MRIAVLGLGFMGSTHLKAWRNVRTAEIAAVCSEDDRKLNGDLSGVQGNLGGAGEKLDFSAVKKYRKVVDVLADKDIDAVDICLPTDLHSGTAIAALRAGKHVLVEKPIGLTGKAADEIIAEAEVRKRTLMAAQVLRFIPAYRALHGVVQENQCGPVHSAMFRRRCAAPFWNKWLGNAAKSGGGVFDLLIHDVDMCLMLFGTPQAVSATGYEDLTAGIDTITATLHYPHVPSVIVSGGWHHKKAYPFSMDYTVVMDCGTYDYSSQMNDGAVTLYGSEGEAHPVALSDEDGFEAELRYFTDCCLTGKRPEFCPPEDSAKAVKLMLLLLEARAKRGEKIECRL